MLLEEESLLCMSVQSTVAQQSSGSEQDSNVVAQCELFPDSAVFGLMWLKYREPLKQLPAPVACAFVAKGAGSSYITAAGKWKCPVCRYPSRSRKVWRPDLYTSTQKRSCGLGLTGWP